MRAKTVFELMPTEYRSRNKVLPSGYNRFAVKSQGTAMGERNAPEEMLHSVAYRGEEPRRKRASAGAQKLPNS